jgi:LCP family protein required for cell wall assembly
VRVDPVRQSVNCLSIPRDTRVYIKGYGLEKITHAHAYGSMPLTIDTVEQFTGIKIDRYISLDYVVFARLVDMLGGIEVNVPKELKTKYFDFKPGKQMMNGRQAYVYINNRSEPMADIDRIKRQHYFFNALLKNLKKHVSALNLAKFYFEIRKNADTSFTFSDAAQLAMFAGRLKLKNVNVETVPGRAEYINGISYWITDQKALKEQENRLFGSTQEGSLRNHKACTLIAARFRQSGNRSSDSCV